MFPVVGIGASAGGLEAFRELLQHLPADTGMAFVLVQHLDPDHESALAQLLSKATTLPVREAANNLAVERNHVYVIPPNTSLSITRGKLRLQARALRRGRHSPIDAFLESLAQERHEHAIGIILSGTATDGTLGLEAIKADGGITFAQDASAKYDSMPRSAVAAGCVDFVLKPADIAKELAHIAKHPFVAGRPPLFDTSVEDERASEIAHESDQAALPSGGRGTPHTGGARARAESEVARSKPGDDGFKKVLILLRNHSGVDFSLYKSSTIQRRIARRMVLSKQHALADYAQFLRGNAKELEALYSDVLISVTSFFRNPETFDILKRKVFPKLLQQRGGEPLRVWVLGCSTGQEAYSIAMAYTEVVEKAARRRELQIFATDLNEALLDKARHGLYAKSLAQDISPERLRRFFVEEEGGYRVSKKLREMVVFARQNLISDPPFSRLHLVSCRNLLIYLEPSLQKKLIPTFHYALRPDGFLLLGASESTGGYSELFEFVDRKHKIYVRKSASTPSLHLPVKVEHREGAPRSKKRPEDSTRRIRQGPQPTDGFFSELGSQREADRITANKYAPPGVLINADLQVLQFRGPTSGYLEPPTGKASFDILKMARDGLMLSLRAAINKAKKLNATVRTENVTIKRNGVAHKVNLEVIPLKNLREPFYLILFDDAAKTAPRDDRSAVSRKSKAGAGTAPLHRSAELERELAETRDYLQSIQEQHEATNEELQAANEEVQSANEELQSINEELETSKEELESANEELTTVNEEMSNRNVELNRLNSDLVNLQNSTHLSIVLLGRDLTIRRFSPQAEKQFNLIAADVGRPIAGLRHNLDMPSLDGLVREVIDTIRETEREVRDTHGRWYSLRVRPYLTLENKVDGAVLVLIDIDTIKRAEQAILEAGEQAEAIVRTVPDPLVILDTDLNVNMANDAFYRAFGTDEAECKGRSLLKLDGGAWNDPVFHQRLEEIIPRNSVFNDLEIRRNFKSRGLRTLLLNARTLQDPSHRSRQILLGIQDITEVLAYQVDLRRSETRYRRLFEAARDGVLLLDPDSGKIIDANPFMTEFLGYSHDELCGKELFEIGLLKDRKNSVIAFNQLRSQGSIRYEDLPLETKEGVHRAVEFVGNLYREDGHEVIQCNVRDISARRQMENALRESEERFRVLFELGPVAVYSCDAAGVILNFNRRAVELWGRAPKPGDTDERFCGSFKMIAPDGSVVQHEDCPMAEVLSGKIPEAVDAEVIIEQPTGARVPVLVNIRPLKDERGEITGAINCFFDISGRKQAESHRALLMAELDHRLKNTLATVQSIARNTIRRAASLDDFRVAFDARLMALSQTHSLLRDGEWKGTTLHEIISTELAPYDDRETGRLTLSGEEIRLNSRQAVALGLALHELTTNAVKYGALSAPSGKVKVEWRIAGANGGAILELRWVETGGPVVEKPASSGFGTELIERGLASDLDADVHLDFHPEGVRFTMNLSLDPREV